MTFFVSFSGIELLRTTVNGVCFTFSVYYSICGPFTGGYVKVQAGRMGLTLHDVCTLGLLSCMLSVFVEPSIPACSCMDG